MLLSTALEPFVAVRLRTTKASSFVYRYSMVEKECLAIKWALDSLHYLLGRKLGLETHHEALSWLSKMRDSLFIWFSMKREQALLNKELQSLSSQSCWLKYKR